MIVKLDKKFTGKQLPSASKRYNQVSQHAENIIKKLYLKDDIL
jgi:hypothetical protein